MDASLRQDTIIDAPLMQTGGNYGCLSRTGDHYRCPSQTGDNYRCPSNPDRRQLIVTVLTYKAIHHMTPRPTAVLQIPYSQTFKGVSITFKGVSVKCVDNVIHLGLLLIENMYGFNMSKCIDNFNHHQCNMFLANFIYCSQHIRNILFKRYCTSFHGIRILPHFDPNIQDVDTA